MFGSLGRRGDRKSDLALQQLFVIAQLQPKFFLEWLDQILAEARRKIFPERFHHRVSPELAPRRFSLEAVQLLPVGNCDQAYRVVREKLLGGRRLGKKSCNGAEKRRTQTNHS